MTTGLLLTLLACSPNGPGFGSTSRPVEMEVTQAEGRNVYTVSWDTVSASDAVVEYGEGDAFDHTATGTTSEDGRHHEVVLAGLAGGVSWQARIQGLDDVVELEPEAAPDSLPALELTAASDADLEGFVLTVIFSNPDATIALLDRQGRIVWWQEVESASAFRAIYDPATRSVTWLDQGDEGSARMWRCALDGQPEQIATLPHAHHDFTAAPDGGWYVLAYDPREVEYDDGTATIYGDEVVHVSADGSEVEQVWSSWTEYPYTDTAVGTGQGLEFPHTNSLIVEPETGALVLSLYMVDALVAVDPATGLTEWQMGGTESDWDVDEGFARQHSPLLVDGGARLALFDNGIGEADDPAEAAVYDLDWDTFRAVRTWAFDDGGQHEQITMGSAVPTAQEDLLVAWGSDAELTRVSADGQVRWEVEWEGDSFGYTSLIEDLAGATW